MVQCRHLSVDAYVFLLTSLFSVFYSLARANNEIGNSGNRLISLTCTMEFNRYIRAEGEGKMTEENFGGERKFLEDSKVLGMYLKSVVKPNIDRKKKVEKCLK